MKIVGSSGPGGRKTLKVVAGGLLYVAVKWTLLFTAGSWALERGHPEALLVAPALLLGAAWVVRRRRRATDAGGSETARALERSGDVDVVASETGRPNPPEPAGRQDKQRRRASFCPLMGRSEELSRHA